MKKVVTGFLAASALAASALAPAFAVERGLTQAQGLWTFDFGNEKVCKYIQVTAGAFPNAQIDAVGAVGGVTEVKVVNTDNTSETFYLLSIFQNSNEAIYKALLAACDHADDNHGGGFQSGGFQSGGDFHGKSYVISVTGTPAAGLLPAVFGGVVGNLPTVGTPNAGFPGFIISVKVKTNS